MQSDRLILGGALLALALCAGYGCAGKSIGGGDGPSARSDGSSHRSEGVQFGDGGFDNSRGDAACYNCDGSVQRDGSYRGDGAGSIFYDGGAYQGEGDVWYGADGYGPNHGDGAPDGEPCGACPDGAPSDGAPSDGAPSDGAPSDGWPGDG